MTCITETKVGGAGFNLLTLHEYYLHGYTEYFLYNKKILYRYTRYTLFPYTNSSVFLYYLCFSVLCFLLSRCYSQLHPYADRQARESI